jgi:hypothetical protein
MSFPHSVPALPSPATLLRSKFLVTPACWPCLLFPGFGSGPHFRVISRSTSPHFTVADGLVACCFATAFVPFLLFVLVPGSGVLAVPESAIARVCSDLYITALPAVLALSRHSPQKGRTMTCCVLQLACRIQSAIFIYRETFALRSSYPQSRTCLNCSKSLTCVHLFSCQE